VDLFPRIIVLVVAIDRLAFGVRKLLRSFVQVRYIVEFEGLFWNWVSPFKHVFNPCFEQFCHGIVRMQVIQHPLVLFQ